MGSPGEQLHRHIFEQGQSGLEELRAQVTDKVDVKNPTNREGLWAY